MKPLVTIVNVENNETLEREMNDAEYADYLSRQDNFEKEQQRIKEIVDKKNFLLEKLGITEEEARLLLA